MKAEGHKAITRAAVQALSQDERQWLGKEIDFLCEAYCMFPDHNGPWEGEWGGENGDPNEPGTPDFRREWNVPYYCGSDRHPLSKKEILTPPGREIMPPGNPPPSIIPAIPNQGVYESRYVPMGAYWTPELYFPRIISALEESAFEDGIRFLGVLLHHIQDRAAFTYWPDLHKICNLKELEKLRITGYKPENLGSSIDDAVTGIEKKMREIVRFQQSGISALRTAYADNNEGEIEEFQLEFYQEAAKLCADLIHTVIDFSDCGHYPNYWGYWLGYPAFGNPTMQNLVDNPSFERDDGSNCPEGWVVNRHDLTDKTGRAEWDWSRMHSVVSKAVRSGERSAKLMWTPQAGTEWIQRWPVAIKYLAPGHLYRFSGWIKTKDATGKSFFLIRFYDGINQTGEVSSQVFEGTDDWRQTSFEFEIPENADRMRLACRSDGNSGAVWFDDVEIIRLNK